MWKRVEAEGVTVMRRPCLADLRLTSFETKRVCVFCREGVHGVTMVFRQIFFQPLAALTQFRVSRTLQRVEHASFRHVFFFF
jgi:hypothetical protein